MIRLMAVTLQLVVNTIKVTLSTQYCFFLEAFEMVVDNQRVACVLLSGKGNLGIQGVAPVLTPHPCPSPRWERVAVGVIYLFSMDYFAKFGFWVAKLVCKLSLEEIGVGRS